MSEDIIFCPSDHHRRHKMQVCKSEDLLQLGEEDVREMLRDEEVTPLLLLLSSRINTLATFSLAMCPRCAVCSER